MQLLEKRILYICKSCAYRLSVDQQLPVARQLFVRLFVVHPHGPENRFGLCYHGHPTGAAESRQVFQPFVVVRHFFVLHTQKYLLNRNNIINCNITIRVQQVFYLNVFYNFRLHIVKFKMFLNNVKYNLLIL